VQTAVHTAPQDAPAQSARRWAERTRWFRWPAAFVVVFVAVAAAVAALYVDAAAVCKDAVAGRRTIDVCTPPSVGHIGLLFIPAILLLLPDLSEINVFGFGFKRDLEETKDKVEVTVRDQVEKLSVAVARLEELSPERDAIRRLAFRVDGLRDGVRDLAVTTDRDTDVLRATLETLASLQERLVRLERHSGDERA
jgi:hypothetical protein